MVVAHETVVVSLIDLFLEAVHRIVIDELDEVAVVGSNARFVVGRIVNCFGLVAENVRYPEWPVALVVFVKGKFPVLLVVRIGDGFEVANFVIGRGGGRLIICARRLGGANPPEIFVVVVLDALPRRKSCVVNRGGSMGEWTQAATEGRVVIRSGLFARLGDTGYPFVFIVAVDGPLRLVAIHPGVGMVFVRRPLESAIVVVNALGKGVVVVDYFRYNPRLSYLKVSVPPLVIRWLVT